MPFAHLIARACAMLALTVLMVALMPMKSRAEELAHALPPPAADTAPSGKPTETAVLAGGCFWGLEGVFEHVRGIMRVRSGYAGGDLHRATYDAVSTGMTGNAESVEIVFDPRVISYGQILQVYFSVATDPTQLNRQGPDDGTQYRGNIFYIGPDQERVARGYIAQLEAAHAFSSPIVTRVDALNHFIAAEGYHQNYLSLHPTQPYIVANDMPKLANLRRYFPNLYTSTRAS